MSKAIEAIIECPFYVKEGYAFITCEGLLNGTRCTHNFRSPKEKSIYENSFCAVSGGKLCPHYKNVNSLYERNLRQ